MSEYYLIGIAIMAVVTAALRMLPFAIFSGNKRTPKVIIYLGKVLPYAIMGMLVVYCLKSVDILSGSHGLPELIAIIIVALVHLWKHNTVISVASGTIIYMLLVQFIF